MHLGRYGRGMRFEDVLVDVAERYSLGVEQDSSTPYLSIPVSTGPVDYEEYYSLTQEEVTELMADRDAASAFAEGCRRREHDDRLLLKPGWNRGTPI